MGDYLCNCIDCGSSACPCELAETGDCLVCSRLSGEDTCGCSWAGVCVYNEFVHNGKKAIARREEFEAEITERREYAFDTVVLVLKVGRGFALKCKRPGSYVFLRSPESDVFYNLPVSVMSADEQKGEIGLAIRETGAKSKSASKGHDFSVVRGVYRNGIIGVKNLVDIRGRAPEGKRFMIVTKGIGFAPAVLFTDWVSGRSSIDIYIDKDKIDESLIKDYMPEKLKGEIRYIDLQHDLGYRGTGDNFLVKHYKGGNYDKVLVLASDYYIKRIREIIPVDAQSNNFHICCGEGICGACGVTDENGRCFKMCKCADLPEKHV